MKHVSQYSTMNKYAGGTINVPVPPPLVTSEYILPQFASSGYDTLTAGRFGGCPSASGYFQLQDAYPHQPISYVRAVPTCTTAQHYHQPFTAQRRAGTYIG